MALKTGIEVSHANQGVDDCEENEDDCEYGKCGQGPTHRHVVLPVPGLIDANELEEKVSQSCQIEANDGDDANLVLAAGEEGGENKYDDTEWDGSNGEPKLKVLVIDNDEKLNRETEEKEKIKLEESDVNLIVEKALLHVVVGTNVLENVPSELLIELPGNTAHGNCHNTNDDGKGDEKAPQFLPQVWFPEPAGCVNGNNCIQDLIRLEGGKYEECKIGDADNYHLNRVLHAKSIPYQHHLVHETEDEESQEGWHGLELRANVLVLQAA